MINQFSLLFGCHPEEFVPITEGFHNTIYIGPNSIIRISSTTRRNIRDIEGELEFLFALDKEGIPVSLPRKSLNGKYIENLNGQYLAVSFNKASGIPVNVTDANIWNKDLFFHWGVMTGKMHKAAKTIQINRPIWTEEKPDLLGLLPRIQSHIVKERYLELLTKLVSFKKDPDLFGLIHNDFHQVNFHIHDRIIKPYDFDDCAYHWFAYDLAVSFYHAHWQTTSFTYEDTEFTQVFWASYLQGYKQENILKKEIIQQIPIFLKIREIYLYMLFLEKWDLNELEDWQAYTLKDLEYKIENKISFLDNMWIDNTINRTIQ
jgi:amicoumacin kinase